MKHIKYFLTGCAFMCVLGFVGWMIVNHTLTMLCIVATIVIAVIAYGIGYAFWEGGNHHGETNIIIDNEPEAPKPFHYDSQRDE